MKKTFIVEEGKDNMEIRKVLERNDGVKLVIVPKHSNIFGGDYVRITKVKEVDNG